MSKRRKACGPYEVGPCLGVDRNAVIFRAFHQPIVRVSGANHNVTLRIILDRECVREELARLARLSQYPELATLNDYFCVPFRDVADFLEPELKQHGQSDWAHDCQPNESISVLVLNLLEGECPISGQSFDPQQGRLQMGEWIIESHGSLIREKPAWPLTVYERFRFLQDLVERVARAHELDVVHGDLSPEHILLDPETNNVHIVDFGNGKTPGAPFWNSPWHHSMKPDSDALPPQADTYMIFLWALRLLGDDMPQLRKYILRCCNGRRIDRTASKKINPEQLTIPDVDDFATFLAKIQPQPFHLVRYTVGFVAGLICGMLI